MGLPRALFFFSIIVSVAFALTVYSNGKIKGTSDTQDDFLTVSGANLVYRGQNIILKGVNFDNIPALDAGIGSGNVHDVKYTESDYQTLSSFGGNVARFGLAFSWYKNQKNDFFSMLDTQISYARKHNVWIILNLFTTPGNCYEGYSNYCGIWYNNTEQNSLKEFWAEVATRYKDEPVIAGYDLLNEPTPPGPGWSNTWFDFAQILRNTISDVDSRHFVIIESTSDPVFTRIFSGSNIVYSVHDYTPLSISHADEDDERQYPGYANAWNGSSVYWDKTAFAGGGNSMANLRQVYPINWAKTRNVPLFIGEWGTRSTYEGYATYVRDRAELYNEWGVHHAYYTWRHDPVYWKWGVFPREGALVSYDQSKLDAMKVSWQGSIKPQFLSISTSSQSQLSVSPTPRPTATPIATATPSASPSPTATSSEATLAPVVIPAPPAGSGNGLLGTYFATKDFKNPVFSRVDSDVNFNWNYGPPDPLLPWDYYSIEWNGFIKAPKSGQYTIFTHSDDGVRVWLGGELIIDNWVEHEFTENLAKVTFEEGKEYPIKIRYYENWGRAAIKLWWQEQTGEKTIIPSSALYPASADIYEQKPAATPNPAVETQIIHGLRGSYFASRDLTNKKFDRVDTNVDFNWGFGAPNAQLPRGNFSVEWNGYLEAPHAGVYTLFTQSDDGVRLWFNDQLVIDDWSNHAFTERSNKVLLQAGKRYPIKLQYFEKWGAAAVKLWWQQVNFGKQIIPSEYLFTP